jgi:DNA-binding PadR family transcriptional regulator
MLSNTAYVILGFLQRGPASGYDIKQKIDGSTRFFFASSYGQIYPDLKKLESRGLIAGSAKSQGQRARTEYALTKQGRAELEQWLLSPGDGAEMRDEALLKLFFSLDIGREAQIDRLKAMRAERVASLAQLKEVEKQTAGVIPEMPELVLGHGLELYEFIIGWIDRAIAQLESTPPRKDIPLATSSKE